MLKTYKTYLLSLIILIGFNLQDSFALNWQKLHDIANDSSLKKALKNIKKEPENVDTLYILAIVYFNNHMDKEAKDVFERISGIQPDCFEANWGLAEYQRRIYAYEEAKSILNDLIKNHPEFSPAYITLSYIKYMETSFEDVIGLMATVINQGLDNVDLLTYVRAHCLYAGAKGMIAYNGGPVSKMLNGPAVFKHLKIAQSLKPDAISVYFGFGCYYLLKTKREGQNLDKAEEFLKKALLLDPLFADGYVRLSQVYNKKGDKEKAELFLNKALKIDPKNILAADMMSNECKFICQ